MQANVLRMKQEGWEWATVKGMGNCVLLITDETYLNHLQGPTVIYRLDGF